MSKLKRLFGSSIRHPKTKQELRANQDRNNSYVRGKRRNIPTAYDDLPIKKKKSWKNLSRKTQYRENKHGYEWHKYKYSCLDRQKQMVANNIRDWLERLECFYERTSDGLKWFGPHYWIKDHCRYCHTKLISDMLSKEFGDWCPNEDCFHIN